jgi:endo-1,4-beta-xylanase
MKATFSLFASCSLSLLSSSTSLTLRNAADGRIYMGAAINMGHFNEYNYTNTASQEYDLATAENECKWSATEPEQGVFDYSQCDTIKNFTLDYNMGFRGHNLCWGSYNPAWLVSLSDDDKRSALVNHIQHVVSHYGADVVAWDVVNEALSDASTGEYWFYKESDWYPSVPVN